MERLRVLYMGRETIPDIREAVFTNREKRFTPLDNLKWHKNWPKIGPFFNLIYSQAGLGVQDSEPLHCETQPRPWGWRRQRPLSLQDIFQVDIHNVVRSAPGFKTMELPRDQVALAHFRTLQNGQETFPGLVQEQEEDLNLIRGLTPKILDRVNKVIFNWSLSLTLPAPARIHAYASAHCSLSVFSWYFLWRCACIYAYACIHAYTYACIYVYACTHACTSRCASCSRWTLQTSTAVILTSMIHLKQQQLDIGKDEKLIHLNDLGGKQHWIDNWLRRMKT